MYVDELDKDVCMWASLCHIGALASFIGIPGFIVVLVVWLIKRDEHPYIDEQGKESLNFQISVFLYGIILAIIGFILFFTVVGIPIALLVCIPLAIIISIADIILPIVAAVRTSDGVDYRYPFTIRFIG